MIKVFMSINAAPGNIGDIYIRRQVIRAFDREGVSGFLYAGKMPMSYRDAFDLSERWVMTSSYTKFLWRLGCSYATRKCIFVMAPGPATLGRNFASTLKHILVTFLILIGRITGNRILVLGRAVRAKSKFALFFERLIVRASDMYVVRDSTSSCLLNREKVRPGPDYAFTADLEPAKDTKRRIFASISLRHDRHVDAEALKKLVEMMRSERLVPRLVVQVREDQNTSSALAAMLGIDILDWNDSTPHSAQEKSILSAYGESAIVVSDRLHALIFGAIRGAIPIIVERHGEEKLHATLDTIIGPQSIWLNGKVPIGTIDASDTEAHRIAAGTLRAEKELEKIWNETLKVSGI
mgnify:CR=1 FL=1